MIKSFNKILKEKTNISSGIISIRPKVILSFIEQQQQLPVDVKLQIPSSQIGSLTMLEAMMMISLMKIVNPKNIFEFGTYLGYTTNLLLSNSSSDSKVFSIDLGYNTSDVEYTKNASEKDLKSSDILNDNFLTLKQAQKGTHYLKNVSNLEKVRLKLIIGDSTEYNPDVDNLKNNTDFIFIDGGHTYDLVKKDTETSEKMISEKGIVLWHDFGSKIHGDVTNFLEDFSKENLIYHIEHTMIAFMIIEK
jgi:predicted O-methyltransferase YrrM